MIKTANTEAEGARASSCARTGAVEHAAVGRNQRKAAMQDFRVETFLTVCRTMNYTRAAKALNITQPAVSQHIAHLEKAYGARLFDYRGKRLTLTEAGELVRSTLSTMDHDERLLRERVAAAVSGARIDMSVGMTLTAGEYLVAAPLADYLAKRPDIRATVRSGGTRELLALLEAGEIDCAFVEGMFDRSAYECDVYRRERLVCVCAAEHVLTCGAYCIEDLLSEICWCANRDRARARCLSMRWLHGICPLRAFGRQAWSKASTSSRSSLRAAWESRFSTRRRVARELEAGSLRVVPLEGFRVEHDISFHPPEEQRVRGRIPPSLRRGSLKRCRSRGSDAMLHMEQACWRHPIVSRETTPRP